MSKKKQPLQEETLFDFTPYTHQPGYWEAEDEDIFSDDYINRAMLYLESEPKSTPVARETVERVYFWVETYVMRQRYLHHRFCYIRRDDGIKQVVKVHIPGKSRSIREGRAQLIREAIAEGSSPDQIAALINSW